MALTIHNNLTGKKEKFVPLEEGRVSIYVCGVTVYDDIHMGHARSMVVFDTIARYFRHIGYEVNHVTNFTDVDDKIIDRAAQTGEAPLELSARYIEEYFKDSESLGLVGADAYPKASESMGDIISMVSDIIDAGFGYAAEDGSVYFSVDRVEDYGRLTNQRLEDLESSGRIAQDPHKRNPMDFALWKAAKPGEISWDSPWGKGRPGWHIECSAMIRAVMGDRIDIHGGGNDLIFPHHENEILQTEAVTGEPLANYWVHNGMLQVKGEKMSKSVGNFFRVRDVAARYRKEEIRFYFLNAHYSSPMVYSEEAMEESSAGLRRLWNNHGDLVAYARKPSGDYDAAEEIAAMRAAFRKQMDDDFNTRGAIEALFNLARATNRLMSEGRLSQKGALDALGAMAECNEVLGILPEAGGDEGDIGPLVDLLIEIRGELRGMKAYALADRIRDGLADLGIVLEDTSDGVKWKKG
ncbi:MAG: cysteine--tRNA ligase [Thermoplasmatales archaeon]|nr:cysteine--tRNA ligase [Thermoplasmatales archaeon]